MTAVEGDVPMCAPSTRSTRSIQMTVLQPTVSEVSLSTGWSARVALEVAVSEGDVVAGVEGHRIPRRA